MGTIDQVRGGWRARWRTPDKRSRSKTFTRKADARGWLNTIEHAKQAGNYVDPRSGKVSLADWVAQWETSTVALRPSTAARDRSYIRTHLLPTFGSMPLARIDHMAVRSWVAELSTRRQPATVQKAAQILGKIMRAAVDADLIATSPCDRVPLPRIEREEMRFLNLVEVAALADTIGPEWRALVLVGCYGGLRIGELFGLRVERVDVLHARVDVAEIVTDVSGHLYVGPPKTRAGRRSVPLPRFVSDELDDHIAGSTRTGLVWSDRNGSPLRLTNWRRRVWSPAVEAAGLTPLRPHDMRHTAVALWIAAGASPNEVAARAGHSSVVTVLDRYGHLLPGTEDRVTDTLELMGRTAGPHPDATVLPLLRGSTEE